MNIGKRCRYADDCPAYKGEAEDMGSDTVIHRNVFCYRGRRGWENCHRYQERMSSRDTMKDEHL